MSDSPWLTAVEAGERARVSVKVIYGAIRRGKLKAARVASGYRVHVDWLDAWLDAEAAIVNPHAPGAPHALALKGRG